MDVTGPDANGVATATINYTFPTWLSGSNRALSLYLGATQVAFSNPVNSTGTWIRNVSVACMRPGAYTLTTYATSCQKWNQGGYSATDARAVQAGSKPTLSLTLDGPDATAHATATINFDFPNTSSYTQREVSLW